LSPHWRVIVITDGLASLFTEMVKNRVLSAVTLVLLCAAALFYAVSTPSPAPTLPRDGFSQEQALRHVRVIAMRPHPTGSEDNARVRSYLLSTIAALGLSPQAQEATAVGTRYAVAGRIHNVLVRVPGTNPGGLAVLLMAHYDGVPAAPAAGDDGSGSAALLEVLRALRAGKPLVHDVIALFTDGEEPGLLGAAAFVREHPWAKDVGVVLNFEARGTHGPSLMFETGTGNLDVVRVLQSVSEARATSLSTTVYRKLPNDTDLSELAVLDRPAMNFAFIGGVDRYHTAQDDVAHLNAGSVYHHGVQALALARAFGNGPLPRPRTGDAVFFDLPLVGLIVYPESWALPFAIVALVLVLIAVVRVRASEARWLRDILFGAIGLLATTVLAGALALGMGSLLQRFYGGGIGSPEWSGIAAAVVALVAVAVALITYATVRRRAGARCAHLGALIAWGLLSLFIAWTTPGASFVFTWPLLVVTVAAIVAAERPERTPARIATWTATVVVIALVVPIVYLMSCVALGVSGVGAVILGVFTALGVWLLAPHIESVGGASGERLRATQVWAARALVVLFLFGRVMVRTNENHPAGTSIAYAFDADSGLAWLNGYATSSGARSWLARSLRDVTGSRAGDRLPQWLTRNFEAKSTVIAPLAEVTPAKARVMIVGDSIRDGARVVTLRIVPAPGSRAIAIAADSGVVTAAVDGRLVDTSRYRASPRRWSLQYVAPPDTGFVLALTLRGSAHPTLGVMEISGGIPPLPAVRLPARPLGVLPIQGGDMTWVYSRVQL
jgi:hypothetical protein